MSGILFEQHLADEAATIALAHRLAPLLRVGQTVLLQGQVGAGKSALARAIIRARLGNPAEDVPSPTFTLIQTYPHPQGDIWHCDLYRLSHPQEVIELGLDEAMETAICLIEWPDRLGDLSPPHALTIEMAAGDQAHSVRLIGSEAWRAQLGSMA